MQHGRRIHADPEFSIQGAPRQTVGLTSIPPPSSSPGTISRCHVNRRSSRSTRGASGRPAFAAEERIDRSCEADSARVARRESSGKRPALRLLLRALVVRRREDDVESVGRRLRRQGRRRRERLHGAVTNGAVLRHFRSRIPPAPAGGLAGVPGSCRRSRTAGRPSSPRRSSSPTTSMFHRSPAED